MIELNGTVGTYLYFMALNIRNILLFIQYVIK
jgi:hypothetical protein